MKKTLGLIMLASLASCAGARQDAQAPGCAPAGRYVAADALRAVPDPVPAPGQTVLLGEHHDSAADHAWQLATIERLYAQDPAVALGFEMFPRAAQPVLDRWVRGELTEAELLRQTDWANVWGFDPALYLPIFRFARDRHAPMIALNVADSFVHAVGRQGWAATPDHHGIGTPAPAAPDYRASLAEAMSGHGGPALTPDRLDHFIDAQLLWDRAMAEAIAAHRGPVVAILGVGHIENGWGVPHQLAALGAPRPLVLVPAHEVCEAPGAGYADAIYVD